MKLKEISIPLNWTKEDGRKSTKIEIKEMKGKDRKGNEAERKKRK